MNSDFNAKLAARSLEAEFTQVLRSRRKQEQFSNWKKRFVRSLINFLTGTQAISVREQIKNGSVQWTVYDPHREVRKVFYSEQAVRVWLEQRKNA